MSDLVEKVANAIANAGAESWLNSKPTDPLADVNAVRARAAIAMVLREMMKNRGVGLMPSIIRGGLLEFAEKNGIEVDWSRE